MRALTLAPPYSRAMTTSTALNVGIVPSSTATHYFKQRMTKYVVLSTARCCPTLRSVGCLGLSCNRLGPRVDLKATDLPPHLRDIVYIYIFFFFPRLSDMCIQMD